MPPLRFLSVILALSVGSGGPLQAQQPPSYAKTVRPFLTTYCLECHNAREAKGGLNLDTLAGMHDGGEKLGAAVVAGKPDESPLVLLAEGKKPAMPPKKAKQPSTAEVAVLRVWVAGGAKDDAEKGRLVLTPIPPTRPTAPPVCSLAYRPDGKVLVVGSKTTVLLLDGKTGELLGTAQIAESNVTAVSFNRDGTVLAVAGGTPGVVGTVHLVTIADNGTPQPKSRKLVGHTDLLHTLAFSPDGKLLASAGYDRVIRLWDVTSGELVKVLKDHSDAVYGLSFNPTGTLLASAAADRAVKVWDVASGNRLYTLGESTDWLYDLSWSPDGRHLAAGGVDKSIRVWDVTPTRGSLVHSVFAHDAPIIRLVYSADGTTLYSLSEDRTAKAWDSGRMVERTVYQIKKPTESEAARPADEAMLALAVRPDQKQIAIGRYDGTLFLLDEASGAVTSQPVPVRPKPPTITKLVPNAVQRGMLTRVTLEGANFDQLETATLGIPGATAAIVGPGASANTLVVELLVPASTPAGIVQLGLKNAGGPSGTVPLIVDPFPSVAKREPNESPGTGQRLRLPATVIGAIDRAGGLDWFRFPVGFGTDVGVQILTGPIGSKLDAVLTLIDPATGEKLAESTNGFLGYRNLKYKYGHEYALGVRDREYRGNAEMTYRLSLGELSIITGVYPLGIQRGTEAEIVLDGVNLGEKTRVRMKVPADAGDGSRLPVPLGSNAPLGAATVLVGEFPEVTPRGGQKLEQRLSRGKDIPFELPVPGTANGRISGPGEVETWRFSAKRGQRLLLEVNARRLGSPLDSVIDILDAAGKPLPRATLRCLAKTFTTLRDHDSVTGGIRLEVGAELATNDYLLAGGELMRIRAMPQGPDDDCVFNTAGGQRLGYLGTTPTFHAYNTPLYKVAMHPPGTTFPANGLPIVTLNWRNDDGGPGFNKDSRLVFDPPADGVYQVRVGDARGQGGWEYVYRLTVRPPRPSFTLAFNPSTPSVTAGSATSLNVSADRLDDYDGPIAVKAEGLPTGFSLPPTTIPAGEASTAVALFAEPNAVEPGPNAPLKLVGRAVIEGREVSWEATGGPPKLIPAGDLRTTTGQSEVQVRPGQQAALTVTIERGNGFAGRVPVEVRGLPHGVRVNDIGLNGILITEKESTRTMSIVCEPWVQPFEHPIVVLARSERKGTEHAARSVLLKVVK